MKARTQKDSIFVTKSFLPPRDEFDSYINQIWESGQLTNQGPLLKKFERQAVKYLNINSGFQFVANGTLALQLALRALDIVDSEVITTPFSYVATTSAILWEGNLPVFADIDPKTLNIDPSKIEFAITDKTKAILAVHVFGNPCDVEKIDAIAKRHDLKVIYDAAHAFSVKYKGKSLLDYGDIATCSFHSTKLLHTIEGGCVIARDKKINDRVELMRRFGHNGDDHLMLGINAKASEIQAAMGLCNLNYVDDIIKQRKKAYSLYDNLLRDTTFMQKPHILEGTEYNYAYYPVILSDEPLLFRAMEGLQKTNVFPRRYFYPSLNTLPYLQTRQACPISEDIAKRILCLPLYDSLESKDINNICEVLRTL